MWNLWAPEKRFDRILQLSQILLFRILDYLHPPDWLRLARANKMLLSLAHSPNLWQPYYLKSRFRLHHHDFDLAEKDWITIYKECLRTERNGVPVLEHVKTIDEKPFFSPGRKKKAFRCGYVPTTLTTIFLGGPACGKTSLVQAIKRKRFSENYVSTMGGQKIKVLHPFGDQLVQINIWDCSGQERYNALNQKLLAFCEVVVFFYDCSSDESIFSLKTIMADYHKTRLHLPICLVGLKSDTEEGRRQVSLEEIQNLSQQEGVPFLGEVSAKTGENISKLLKKLYRLFQGQPLN